MGSIEITEDSFERFHQKIHPKILEKFKSLKEAKYPPLSLYESVYRIIKKSGWGEREKAAFSQSSITQYEETIRDLKNDNLADFLEQHFSWPRVGGLMEDQAFATAMSNFESACRNICLSEPTGRLSEILKREFSRNGMADKLKPA